MNIAGIFKSKTIWFNLLSAVITIAGVLPVPPEYSAVVVAVGNLGLRFVTNSALADK